MGPPGQQGNPGARGCLQPPPPGTRVALPGSARTPRAASRTHLRQVRGATFSLEKCPARRQGGGSRQCPGPRDPAPPPHASSTSPHPHARDDEEEEAGAWRPGSAPRPLLQRRRAPEQHLRGPGAPRGPAGIPFPIVALTWLRQSSPLAFASTSTSISTASGLVT